MSLSGLVVFAVGIWATYAGVRTIQRIGLRRFSVAVGRLSWDLGKVALGGAALVAGAMAASAANRADAADSGLIGPDLMDGNDLANSGRPESPWYSGPDIGEYFDNEKEGGV